MQPKARTIAWWSGYLAAVLVAAIVVIGPGNLALRGSYMAWEPPFAAETQPGDHVQMSYYLWLWEDAVRTGDHLPWTDPYQFAATDHAGRQPFGWPLVLVSLPVSLVAGPVAAYNALVVAAFLAAALATAAWVRALGASRWGAGVAGFAFAFAPFRLVQATSHVNALLAFLFPLLLLCLEKALSSDRARPWAWGAAATTASIVASGELHLAVFAALLVPAYLLCRWPALRERWRSLIVPGVAAATASALAGAAQWLWVLSPSVAAGGRSTEEAAANAPRVGNLITRGGPHVWPDFERYAYLGVVVVLLALAGALLTVRRRPWLVGGLAAIVAGGLAMALIPGLVGHPGIQRTYRLIPFLSFSRVPGRSLVLVTLALAGLAGLAVAAVRGRWQPAVAVVAAGAIVVQAPTGLFAVNRVERSAPVGVERGDRVLDLPAFGPGHFSGSVYEVGIMAAPGPRVGGYSPFVTPEAEAATAEVEKLSAVDPDPCAWREVLARHRVERIVVHRDLYGSGLLRWPEDPEAVLAGLDRLAGVERMGERGSRVTYRVTVDRLECDRG